MLCIEGLPGKDDVKNYHEFASSVHVRYSFITEPLFDLPSIAWYIAECDNVVGLYNRNGDFLYDVGDMDPGQVLEMIKAKSYYNWKAYGKAQPLFRTKDPLPASSWSRECIDKCGGNIIIYLTKLHPKRTYQECEFVMKNEGYRIDNKGFLEPIPGLRQI